MHSTGAFYMGLTSAEGPTLEFFKPTTKNNILSSMKI
jgi:hypothetical protein